MTSTVAVPTTRGAGHANPTPSIGVGRSTTANALTSASSGRPVRSPTPPAPQPIWPLPSAIRPLPWRCPSSQRVRRRRRRPGRASSSGDARRSTPSAPRARCARWRRSRGTFAKRCVRQKNNLRGPGRVGGGRAGDTIFVASFTCYGRIGKSRLKRRFQRYAMDHFANRRTFPFPGCFILFALFCLWGDHRYFIGWLVSKTTLKTSLKCFKATSPTSPTVGQPDPKTSEMLVTPLPSIPQGVMISSSK